MQTMENEDCEPYEVRSLAFSSVRLRYQGIALQDHSAEGAERDMSIIEGIEV